MTPQNPNTLPQKKKEDVKALIDTLEKIHAGSKHVASILTEINENRPPTTPEGKPSDTEPVILGDNEKDIKDNEKDIKKWIPIKQNDDPNNPKDDPNNPKDDSRKAARSMVWYIAKHCLKIKEVQDRNMSTTFNKTQQNELSDVPDL